MRFAQPHLLWLLPVLPTLILVFLWWSARKRQSLLTRFIQARLLPELTVGISLRRQRTRAMLLASASALLVLAMARPQWGFSMEEARQRGLDIVVAIDTSKSMLADDIKPTRLERAKLAALDLMQQAKADRLGLIAFAGGAFLQCPLTLDDGAFKQCVDELNVNIIPQGGTALAEAINTAVDAFKKDENFKVLVLFTDGEDHDEGAVKAAQRASEAGMRVFSIGLGTAQGELLRIHDANGQTDYVRDSEGQVVKSRLNEALLQKIAGTAQGFYLPLRGANTMETLYEKGLAPLPKSESETRQFQHYHERYHWPLGLAILLVLIEMLWPERRRQKGSAGIVVRESKAGQAAAILILSAAVLLPAKMDASPSSALKDYRKGNYAEALSEFDALRQQHTNDARLDFNAGAAAYRAGKFDDAVKRFDKAVGAPDLQLQQQAYYNRGNARFRAGQSQSEPRQKQQTWEQAVKDYDSALKLQPDDDQAKFNLAFVKKKLEKLKQQQQQQKQNKDNQQQDKSKKDQNQQKQQSQQNQNKDQQQQQQGQNQRKSKDKNQSQQASQNQQQEKQDKEQNQQSQAENQSKQDKQSEQQKQQEQAQGKQGEQKDQSEQGQQGQTAQATSMTPEQAKRLLDSMKGDEKMLPVQLGKPEATRTPDKDW